MKRLVTALAGVGLMLAWAPPAIAPAASNNATTLIPLPDGTQLETYARLDCHRANGSCDFTVGADRKTADGVTGFPNDLWSRQSTTIRPTDRLAYLDVHATAPIRPGLQARRDGQRHHGFHGRRAAGQIPDHRPDRLDGLADRPTAYRRAGHHVYAHPGRLQRRQHHLTEHLCADHVLLSRRL
jgi:hypothetical protein